MSVECRLLPLEKMLHDEIKTLLHYQSKIIYYDIMIVNHTHNPLVEVRGSDDRPIFGRNDQSWPVHKA